MMKTILKACVACEIAVLSHTFPFPSVAAESHFIVTSHQNKRKKRKVTF